MSIIMIDTLMYMREGTQQSGYTFTLVKVTKTCYPSLHLSCYVPCIIFDGSSSTGEKMLVPARDLFKAKPVARD